MDQFDELKESLDHLRNNFKHGITRSAAWRKSQLQAILRLLVENEDEIFDVLFQDLGKHPIEAYRDEVGVLIKSAKDALSSIDKWMAPKKGWLPLLFFPAKAQVLSEPFGLVLIISSWNFPISLSLEPIIGAISAGNTAVIKLSEHAPASSAFLAKTIPLYLDSKAVKVFEGGPDVADILLQQKWDKIFFTGSARIGRIVMAAAAKHLTPVTLELGGKCPAILDSLTNLADTKVAIERIAGAKWGACNGQACIGIDYVLVESKSATLLIDLLKKTLKRFYGESLKDLKCLARIVNKHQFNRLKNLLEDPDIAASIVHGGSYDEDKLMIEPTILLNPPLDSELMTEEIFGPLLPIITVSQLLQELMNVHTMRLRLDERLEIAFGVSNIQDSIEFINTRPKPLALYAFTKNETMKRRVLEETSSGSVTFNDVMIHFICTSLPFGGVGESGMGRYHGKYSFDAFSHEKAVLHRTFYLELEARSPPWNEYKMKFMRLGYIFDYFGLVMLMLGLKR